MYTGRDIQVIVRAARKDARLDAIEEAARLLDDTRYEMTAPGNLADYGRGILADAAHAIRRLKEIAASSDIGNGQK